ncbi:MAG: UDP-N-acetylmuramoyl-L-alanyl-D-glutamate--2,6-diaminopimelate ligase [Actinobacteria bacterium]|nr:UDP-N-acetylmuramoyl-L-alanyl-D-glutamate--2,6-diaminopimelate ligase [Actinomycetota bacterium]MCG2807303.1 UDP-N-acetylmuramoyl-L-alanyl-D-glutamate--2,6-diaminopimelate ligase [Coriobacteriia bacterium]
MSGTSDVLKDAQIEVSGVAYRSDAVVTGDVFFCIPGFVHDGHDFAHDAVSRGAVAVVAQRPIDGLDSVPLLLVENTRIALAQASSRFFGTPSKQLDVIGITGTNGKTTTTYILDSVMRAAGRTTGLIGTVETRIGDTCVHAARTTPESLDLQRLLAGMVEAGVGSVAMEVSSHAIDLHRVEAVQFAVAAFTNLTQDHLDYHHTIEEYFSVKKRLFTDLEVEQAVINIDDPLGAGLAAELDEVLTVGLCPEATIRAEELDMTATGTRFMLRTPDGDASVDLPLAGLFNVSNALVAAGCALCLGVGLEVVVAGLEAAPQVPGRLERIDAGQPFAVYVDYAHTPDSLDKAIRAVRALVSGRVITVFGCGGDRDLAKRPLMGRAAAFGSDHVIVTSDNPRTEDPVGIILQVQDGLREGDASYEVEPDRRAAIARAVAQAAPDDAVLIAGKGHEDYQIFADRTIDFDDRVVAREELERLC